MIVGDADSSMGKRIVFDVCERGEEAPLSPVEVVVSFAVCERYVIFLSSSDT